MRRYFIIPEGLNAIELQIYYYLCNQTNYSDSEYKGKKKFEFNCSLRTIEEDIGINKKTISQILKKFENDGLIELIVKGKPPKTPSKYKLKFLQTVGMTGVTIDYTIKETIKETIEPVENTSVEEGKETIKETIKETMKGTPSNIIYNKSNIYNEQKVAQDGELNKQIEKLWKEYPKKRGKIKAFKKLPKVIKEYGFEQILRAVTRYKEEIKDKDFQFIMQGDTFFNNGYGDYLDNNYDVLAKEQKELQEQQQGQNKKIKQPTLVTDSEEEEEYW